jgi:hypothetical protein
MDRERIIRGFGWGVVATVAMSVLMLIGLAIGMSPMPRPIPAAIVGQLLGEGTAKGLIMMLAAIAHLGYGGLWGAVLALTVRPVTVWKGVAMGLFLWALMGFFVLPALGWGMFGAGITAKIAFATLMLHLVYGITLGWLVDRKLGSAAPDLHKNPV